MTNAPDGTGTLEWTGHPSHWSYFWRWLIAIVFIIGGGAFAAAGAVPAAALCVVGLITVAWIFIDRARHTYMVTSRTVMIETGLIAKSSNEVRVQDVRSINLVKHGLVGFIGVGDLEISSAATDKAEITFKAIPHAAQVRDLVRKYQAS